MRESRFIVALCHDGTDYCVRRYGSDPGDDLEDETLTHAEACELAAKLAAELCCRWFDFSGLDAPPIREVWQTDGEGYQVAELVLASSGWHPADQSQTIDIHNWFKVEGADGNVVAVVRDRGAAEILQEHLANGGQLVPPEVTSEVEPAS